MPAPLCCGNALWFDRSGVLVAGVEVRLGMFNQIHQSGYSEVLTHLLTDGAGTVLNGKQGALVGLTGHGRFGLGCAGDRWPGRAVDGDGFGPGAEVGW